MIQVGDKIPDGTLLYVPYTPNEDILACPIPQPYKIHDNFKGVSEVVCMSVADGFVMNAFAKASHTGDKVIMAGDGSAEFTKTLGLDQDLTANGMGIRSKRFAIVVDDLTVTYVGVETARGVSVSGADAVLAKL